MTSRKTYYLLSATFICLLLGCKEKETPETSLFTVLTPEQSGVQFSNQVVESDSFNINQYLYAYNGAGVALGDVNNDGLVDIYLGANQTNNRLFLNRGGLQFEDVTEQAGVSGWVGSQYWTTGLSMVDINHDGWLDIYVNQVTNLSHLEGHNLLYINNQDGTFSERSGEYGLDFKTFAQQTVFFDYDLDGDLDAYLLNHSLHELDVYVKAVKRDRPDRLAGDRLLRNEGGVFRDVSQQAGIFSSATGYGLAISVADLDNNGCPDIYISNDFHENDYLYLNQCDGTFKEELRRALPYCSTFSMGSDIADVNNDGLLDIMTLDMKPEDEVIRKTSSGADPFDIYNYKLSFGYHEQYPRNMLHINRGAVRGGPVRFSEIAQQSGMAATDWSWSVLLADLDNDRHKDVFITNGIYRRPNDLDYINYTFHDGQQGNNSSLELVALMPDGKAANYAYRNVGNLQFENVSDSWGLDLESYSMGSAYADLDNDGDLDLVVNNLNAPSTIYRNNTEHLHSNNFLKIKLEGPEQNPFGIGARVELYLDDQPLTQEVFPIRAWLSSSTHLLNFGLGKFSLIDSLVIRWPDGRMQRLSQVTSNQTVILEYDNAQKPKNFAGEESVKLLMEPVKDPKGIQFKHQENEFIDFTRELLLPHALSREGPGMATGDINDDGKDDLFVGGAAGQPGTFFLQSPKDGSFREWTPKALEEDAGSEDVAATLFDADQDGDLDLLVVSGGGQFTGKENSDRLYLNDGFGHFLRSAQFPELFANGACVVAADFNKDNLIDLFIGNRSVVGNYGNLPDAHLLWNRGKGHFELDNTNSLKSFGMISGAAWDHKGQQLLIVGEFMPITILRFDHERFSQSTLAHSAGWWNTIHPVDIDQDGDLDFLAGNYGLNSPLQASPAEPVRLIVKDWDHNGQPDPLLTYYRQGKEWFYHGLDDIKKQIPAIRLRFNDYHLYAKHSVQQTFSEADLQTAAILKAETFASVLLLNQGDGRFTLKSLPPEAQTSPTYAFYADDLNGDGITDVLVMGNAAVNTPSIGNQKASLGCFLQGLDGGIFQSIPTRQSGLQIVGEVRDLKTLEVQNDKWIVVAKNNGKLEVWHRGKEQYEQASFSLNTN